MTSLLALYLHDDIIMCFPCAVSDIFMCLILVLSFHCVQYLLSKSNLMQVNSLSFCDITVCLIVVL